MKLKVFKLKGGKLQFEGIREVQAGDCILSGGTSMAEVTTGLVRLRESDGDGRETPVTPADKDALKASFKRLKPDASERELDILVAGRDPDAKKELHVWPI